MFNILEYHNIFLWALEASLEDLSSLRNTALVLLRLGGCSNIVEGTEIFAEDKEQAQRIVGDERTKGSVQSFSHFR